MEIHGPTAPVDLAAEHPYPALLSLFGKVSPEGLREAILVAPVLDVLVVLFAGVFTWQVLPGRPWSWLLMVGVTVLGLTLAPWRLVEGRDTGESSDLEVVAARAATGWVLDEEETFREWTVGLVLVVHGPPAPRWSGLSHRLTILDGSGRPLVSPQDGEDEDEVGEVLQRSTSEARVGSARDEEGRLWFVAELPRCYELLRVLGATWVEVELRTRDGSGLCWRLPLPDSLPDPTPVRSGGQPSAPPPGPVTMGGYLPTLDAIVAAEFPAAPSGTLAAARNLPLGPARTRALRVALEEAPDDPVRRHCLAFDLYIQSQYLEARARLLEMRTEGTLVELSTLILGCVADELGDRPAARAEYRAALMTVSPGPLHDALTQRLEELAEDA
jgi:hypothetical protein